MTTITVTEKISDLDAHNFHGHDLWLTPGSSAPYWASQGRFRDDFIVADVWDFMTAAGYDLFDEAADYEATDEEVSIEIELD